MAIEEMYRSLGVCPKVYSFGEDILTGLKERFEAIDRTA